MFAPGIIASLTEWIIDNICFIMFAAGMTVGLAEGIIDTSVMLSIVFLC